MSRKQTFATLSPGNSLGVSGAAGRTMAMEDAAWIDVIRKMDEVYSDLLEHQVALEEKNQALEETRQFLESVLNAMSDVLIVCDRYGQVVQVNRALAGIVGYSEQELQGMRLSELFADPPSRERAEQFPSQLQPQPITDCEVQLQARDGDAIPVTFSCSARQDSHGHYVGMVLVGRPVGELRKAYRALRETHEELQSAQQQLLHSEKMASLGKLVAGVAHELNNPISFVLGNVHALGRYTQRLRRYLEAVHAGEGAESLAELRRTLRIDHILADLDPLLDGTLEGAERTRDIVDALKRFSVVDREEPQVFNLTEVVERAIHWVAKAAGPGFSVAVELPDVLAVNGTAAHLQQVIINLVQNAHDATAGRPDPQLTIDATVEGGVVVLRFRDNGPGIEPADLPRIFDPFYTTKPVGKGTGLGLSISYGIVERHRGRLEADNAEDGGAEFRLHLPLVKLDTP